MAQPKPSTVVLILAVFACVALYVLGVGLDAQDRSAGGRPTMSKQEREALRERILGKPRPVEPEALKATGCEVSGGVVRVSPARECWLDISESGTRLRAVEVEPLAGSRVEVLSLRCVRPVGNPPECSVRLR
jgi:hypothetical protein